MFAKMKTWMGVTVLCGSLALASSAVAAPKYDPGASDTEIKIGNTMPYSGPGSTYATMGHAFSAYFQMINDRGGINGRKIKFLSYDDGYSPPKTVEQVRRLVEQDEVLLVFFTLGTPTSSAVFEYLNQKQIPHLFVGSGASKFNDPKGHPWSLGPVGANYLSQGQSFGRYALRQHAQANVGILYQNDDYGRDFVKGFKDGLGPEGRRMIVAEQTYESTDTTIDSQVVALKSSGATVFFDASIAKFAAQAIRKMDEIGWKPLHLLAGPAASIETTFKPAGIDRSIGIMSGLDSDKDPADSSWADDPGVREYRDWISKYYPDGNPNEIFNIWAYNNAVALAYVLERSGDDLTRANLMRVATNLKGIQLPMKLPGITLETSPTDHAPVEDGYITRFDGARMVRVELFTNSPMVSR